jgi:hypothetical protein
MRALSIGVFSLDEDRRDLDGAPTWKVLVARPCKEELVQQPMITILGMQKHLA